MIDDGTDYRVGSPFASDPAAESARGGSARTTGPADPSRMRPESLDEGVWGQTAAAALLASALLIPFAIAGSQVFPAGGLSVAVLGAALAIIGSSSRPRFASPIALVTHIALSVACYWRM